MNINAIEKALIAFRDKKVEDGMKCTGLRIRVDGQGPYILGNCGYEIVSATKAVLDKGSNTLTLTFHHESYEPRPRTEIIDCDHVSMITVDSSRYVEVSTDGIVEIL